MKLSLRFIVPLVMSLALLAYALVPLVERLTLRWFVGDLDIRSRLLANTIQEPLVELLATNARSKISAMFNRAIQDERLFAIGYCDAKQGIAFRSSTFPEWLKCQPPKGVDPQNPNLVQSPEGLLHVVFSPLTSDRGEIGKLVLVHDMSFVERRSADTKRYLVILLGVIAGIASILTVAIAQWSWRGWISGTRALIRGELLLRPMSGYGNAIGSQQDALSGSKSLQPVAADLRRLVQELHAERHARDESQISWTADSLRAVLHNQLSGDQVLVVSNREPYIHNFHGAAIEVQRPASGLVTAMEPVMRACSGTWIAHGGGTADQASADANGRIAVPPGEPAYQLRRVWLSKEEEAGYYYGFANEGIWPLCHVAHTRPTFRTSDWKSYELVNKRFAEAVVSESRSEDPVVLVQDYHFALLPRYIRARLPNATIITFWHIPWPNPESFAMCPWGNELLDGLLGSTIIGFHTQYHCNNFFDTVDRNLEARIDREMFDISYREALTEVKPYPISIEWPSQSSHEPNLFEEARTYVQNENRIRSDTMIGVGVDRLDYTKGVVERFLAVERLLESKPEWIGRFTFIQIAAPTRTSIDRYQSFEAEVRAQAHRINTRFRREGYQPIVLRVAHHEPPEVALYYRAAQLCYVSSLHDGMNLVAKEFVAARADESGVLVLSQFTGAARELPEAILVNPYHLDQCAAALDYALRMPRGEQTQRMHHMRAQIREFNVYRWAGRMLLDAARVRQRTRVGPVAISMRT